MIHQINIGYSEIYVLIKLTYHGLTLEHHHHNDNNILPLDTKPVLNNNLHWTDVNFYSDLVIPSFGLCSIYCLFAICLLSVWSDSTVKCPACPQSFTPLV